MELRDGRHRSPYFVICSPDFNGQAGSLGDNAVGNSEQNPHRCLYSRTGMNRMRRDMAIAAENRTDVGYAAAEILLHRLDDADIDLVAGIDLHGILGSECMGL